MPFYAVATGKVPGVYTSWSKCSEQVDGFPCARFKKFESELEAYRYIEMERLVQIRHSTCSKKQKDQHGNVAPPKKHVIDPLLFTKNDNIDWDTSCVAYTDGSCHKNGSQTATAGVGVYFGAGDVRNISLPYPNDGQRKTNNRAELLAIKMALCTLVGQCTTCIDIVSDSTYCMLAIRKRYNDCNGQPPPNRDLIDDILKIIKSADTPIRIRHVRSHQSGDSIDIVGNRHADELAEAGAKRI